MMNKTSKKIQIFLKTFLIFIILVIAFLVILINGISINNIKIANVEIHDFYLKLDKKLILNANQVYIKKANNENLLNIDKIKRDIKKIDKFKRTLLLFQSIDIKNLHINDNKISIFYNKEIFDLKTNDLTLKMTIDFYSKELIAKITQLKYKNLNFFGDLKIAKSTQLTGKLNSSELNANITILHEKNNLFLKIEKLAINDQIKALENINSLLNEKLQEWLVKRVKFDTFTGDFEFYFKNNALVKANGAGEFQNVNAKYNDNAAIAFAKKLDLNLNNLQITLNGKDLVDKNGVKADLFLLKIDNIFKPNISINIIANNAKYDEKIENILNAFGVNLNLTQTNGQNKAKVLINLNRDHSKKIIVNVDTKGEFNYKNLNFKANANINVENNFIKIQGDIDLDKIIAKEISLNIDAVKKTGAAKINNLLINYDDYFKYENNANISINDASVFFEELKAKINFKDNLKINANIKNLLPYSKYLQKMNFLDGDITLIDENNLIKINILNSIFNQNLYKNTELLNTNNLEKILAQNEYSNDDFFIILNKNNLKINSKSNHININNDEIKLNNIIYKIDKNNDFSSTNSNITLNNSKIIYGNYIFDFKKFQILKENKTIKIDAEFKNGGKLIGKIDDEIKLYLRNFKANELNKILSKEIFLSGIIDFDIFGNNFDDFSGLINIKEAFLANTKSYISLIKILDAIPSLVTFKKNRKNNIGLGIKIGSIEFRKKQNEIKVDAMNIKGYAVDASGAGKINLQNNELDFLLNIFTLKSTNNIINNIPLVKEILIGGKNKKIATQLKIYGNVQDIKFKTSVAKDILLSPFTIIKNIATFPKNLLDR